jgi:outer membrane lipoprotein-sorting protein
MSANQRNRWAALVSASILSLVRLQGPEAAGAAEPDSEWTVETVLARVDAETKRFRSATAEVEIKRFATVAVVEPEVSGRVYVHPAGKLRLDLTEPGPRTLLCLPGAVYLYYPDESLVERHKVGKFPERIEQFLLVGFADRGTRLDKSYYINLLGVESVDDETIFQLELIPKQVLMRSIVSELQLYISDRNWLPVKQKAFQGSPDSYAVVRYSNVELNAEIDGALFNAKWPKGTKSVGR